MIEEVGLKQNHFSIIQSQLHHAKYIADTLKCSFIVESYDKMILTIEEYIEDKISSSNSEMRIGIEDEYNSIST